MVSKLALLLEELARRNGMDGLDPDGEGRFHIMVDEDVPVACFERFGQLHLVSPLGSVPPAEQGGREWLQRLLNCALMQMKQSRSTPAVGKTGDAVLFGRCEIADLSVQDLEALMEGHLNAFERYRRVLGKGADAKRLRTASAAVLRP